MGYTQNITILGLHNRNVSRQQEIYLVFLLLFPQLKLLLTQASRGQILSQCKLLQIH